MKMVKNISIVAFAASFMFAGVGFHYSNNYTGMDSGTTVNNSWGVTYGLNDNTSVGWDSELGMLMYFDVPAGVTLRLGWTAGVTEACAGFAGYTDEADCLSGEDDELVDLNDGGDNVADDNGVFTAFVAAKTSVGLGFTWWSGGTGLKTSISTNYDYVMAPTAVAPGDQNGSNLSVVVGFGF